MKPLSVADLDLAPIPGKAYWNTERDWHEDFMYFLLVDRFHDGRSRKPAHTSERAVSRASDVQLQRFCGGTLKGIRDHLDYIAGLGCTALWISPIQENNGAPDPASGSYHGYAIQNYLDVDPRFGTKQDLVDVVTAAHARDMRVCLDAVLNHSGDNWAYPNGERYFYHDDQQFPFGAWRMVDRPLPLELRNPDYYHRRGEIRNFDALPEAQHGDFFSLKDYNNEEDAAGLGLQDALIRSYCYWIREADIDGFRLDAVKHMGPMAVERFCSAIREYAERLGKRRFFLFGELIAGDDAIDRYIGPNTPTQDHQTVYYGLSSALDFPLYFVLPSALKGFTPPTELFARFEAFSDHALSRGEIGRYLVTFLDNHDQVGQDPKCRFAAGAPDAQVIAGVGILLCSLGTACIYYGTEQGLAGIGQDYAIREPLFDVNEPDVDFLNPECRIYQAIANIASVCQASPALRFGRMYLREVSGNGLDFGPPQAHPCTLAFSRILAGEEVLVAYNTSTTNARDDYVLVDDRLQEGHSGMVYLYGGCGSVPIQQHLSPADSSRFVQLHLEPMQLVILR